MTPELSTLLYSEDPDIRRSAIEQLQQQEPDLETVPIVVQMLLDPSPGVRDAANTTLKNWKNPNVAAAIAPLITNRQPTVLNIAGELLVYMGSDSVERLIPYIHVNDVDAQKFAIDVLGLIGDKRIAPHLLRALDYKDDNVAYAAVEALGNCHIAEGVEKLKTTYKYREMLRHAIIETLGKIGSRESLEFLFEQYHDEDPLIQFAILEALGNIGDAEVIPTLLDIIRQQTQYDLRTAALRSLVELIQKSGTSQHIPQGFQQYFIEIVLKDKGKEHPWAVESLMWFEGLEIWPPLAASLGTEPQLDEKILAYFLREPDKAFHSALSIFATTPEPPFAVLRLLHDALGQLNSADFNDLLLAISFEDLTRVLEYVEHQWNDPNPEMRQIVVDILFKLDADRATVMLQELINDTESWNKIHALELMNTIEDERIPVLLTQLLEDPDDLVREAAEQELRRRDTNGMLQFTPN